MMKIASALRAANSRPCSEEPAWNSTGVRCGEGSDRCGPTTSGRTPDVVDVVDLRRVGVDAALEVADHGVVLPAALEQLVEHRDVLLGAPVAIVVRRAGEP